MVLSSQAFLHIMLFIPAILYTAKVEQALGPALLSSGDLFFCPLVAFEFITQAFVEESIEFDFLFFLSVFANSKTFYHGCNCCMQSVQL